MGFSVDAPMKGSMDLKLPMLTDTTEPKKDPLYNKVLVIKLPLDIDIRIQRENHRIVAFFFTLVLLLIVPFFLVYSYHRQLQVYEYHLAAMRMKASEISFTVSALAMTSAEMQQTVLKLQSIHQQCECGMAANRGTYRRKRDTNDGQKEAVKAENDLSDDSQQTPSNDTMRGNVKVQRRLLKNDRRGNGFGQIGPWFEDKQAVGDFGLRSCNLRDRGYKLIVNETGLYFIYAQVTVYYLTSKTLNSYSINVSPGNKATSTPVAFCSANASLNDQGASEISCFTAVVKRLQAGDAVSIQQQERQRRLIMRDGHSFVGLARLS